MPAVDRLDHLGQRVDRRRDAVELAAAVVRDDDRGGAVLAREPRVLGGERPLQDDGQTGERRRSARRRAHVTDGEIGSSAVTASGRRCRAPSRPSSCWIVKPVRRSRSRRPSTGVSTVSDERPSNPLRRRLRERSAATPGSRGT